MADRPNVLLVILDSMRAKNMSLYGYSRKTTPFLEKFSSDATVYTQARSPGIHSIASHVSMFTGLHVEEHRCIQHTAQIDTRKTIWHRLRSEYGYQTGLFTNNRIISNASNLGESFDVLYSPKFSLNHRLNNKIPRFQNAYYPSKSPKAQSVLHHLQASLSNDHPVKSLINCVRGAFIDFVKVIDEHLGESATYKSIYGAEFTSAFVDWCTEQNGPWAGCINLMDTHQPYEPRVKFDLWSNEDDWDIQSSNPPQIENLLSGYGWDRLERLESLYDGTIRQTDAIVGDLVKNLDRSGELSNTLLIITSDHGEGFGEQSKVDPCVRMRGHLWGIHEVLTHVPLIVKYPGQLEGTSVEQVVSLTDLPDVIQTIVDGEPSREVWPSTSPVLASTYRLLAEEAKKYDHIGCHNAYLGPWRAVYENNGSAVRKYARKQDYCFVGDIWDAQRISKCEESDITKVENEFGLLSNSGLLIDTHNELEDDLESHLRDLGYLR